MRLDPASTLYLVASKSGGTIEPISLYAIFRAHAPTEALGREAAGTALHRHHRPRHARSRQLAGDDGFRAIVHTPPDVGGRFSALTPFGLVPAALIGADLSRACSSARRLPRRPATPPTRRTPRPSSRPSSRRARSWRGQAHARRDPDAARASGCGSSSSSPSHSARTAGVSCRWSNSPTSPRGYGADRAVVVVRMTATRAWPSGPQSQRGRHPVYRDRARRRLRHRRGVRPLGARGRLVGLLARHQPVRRAQRRGGQGRDRRRARRLDRRSEPAGRGGQCRAHLRRRAAQSRPSRSARRPRPSATRSPRSKRATTSRSSRTCRTTTSLLAPLHAVVPPSRPTSGAAVCLELGPRYLHSTGQLHKGGPNSGVFMLVTTQDAADVEVPGQDWSLRKLYSRSSRRRPRDACRTRSPSPAPRPARRLSTKHRDRSRRHLPTGRE